MIGMEQWILWESVRKRYECQEPNWQSRSPSRGGHCPRGRAERWPCYAWSLRIAILPTNWLQRRRIDQKALCFSVEGVWPAWRSTKTPFYFHKHGRGRPQIKGGLAVGLGVFLPRPIIAHDENGNTYRDTLTFNQGVTGSRPVRPTKLEGLPCRGVFERIRVSRH